MKSVKALRDVALSCRALYPEGEHPLPRGDVFDNLPETDNTVTILGEITLIARYGERSWGRRGAARPGHRLHG